MRPAEKLAHEVVRIAYDGTQDAMLFPQGWREVYAKVLPVIEAHDTALVDEIAEWVEQPCPECAHAIRAKFGGKQ